MRFQQLGLVEPPGDKGSRAERVAAVLGAIGDRDLEPVAKALLSSDLVDAFERNAIEDALWAGQNYPPIQKRTRRELVARHRSLAG